MVANFSIRLKELRTKKGLTQRQLAKEVGIAQGNVSRWEKGTQDPSTEWIIQLAFYFDVTTDYLLGVTSDF